MNEISDLDSTCGNEADSRTHLLAEADSRTCVEGKEDKGIRNQILLESVVDESVRVEFVGFFGGSSIYIGDGCIKVA